VGCYGLRVGILNLLFKSTVFVETVFSLLPVRP